MANITDFNKCKKILKKDFKSLNNINKLLEYKVCLIDSYNFAFKFEEYGTTRESLERGFIVPIIDSSAQGFVAKDTFMAVNISNAIKEINNRLDYLYFEDNKIKFLDLVQENEFDLSKAEELKGDYEENEVMTLEELGRNVSVELANIMLECGYGNWIFFRHNNIKEYKEDLKSILENDRDIKDVAKKINTTYDELVNRIEEASEDKEKIKMFKVHDFYCEFAKEKEELEIFISKDNELIKVNRLFFNENTEINKMKDFIESSMCNEIGKVLEDGTIEKVYFRQGYIYKNYENFYKREGICYVSEYDGDNIKDAGITFEEICQEVLNYLNEFDVNLDKISNQQIAEMALDLFEEVDWQFVCSLISDDWLEGYVENLPDEYFINGKNPIREESQTI